MINIVTMDLEGSYPLRFLLAHLHIDSLVGKRSLKAIRIALGKLPTGSEAYDRAYEDAMERIQGQIADSQELAKQVLSWITCAKRPLTTIELQHALAVEIGEKELDEDNLPEIEDMVSVCAGLVTFDEESNIIRLVHYTTQEYFERTWASWFPDAQGDIARTCLTYLSFRTFGTGLCILNDEFNTRLMVNPLYGYAARNWGHHARAASTEVEDLILHFLGREAEMSASIQVMEALRRWDDPFPSESTQITGMHLAAYFGLTNAILVLLKSCDDINSMDTNGQVKLLPPRNVEADSKDNGGLTPLSWAALSGHEAVVNLLLGRSDVEADSYDDEGRTPLSWAAWSGHEAVVQLLLGRSDVEADSENNGGQTPVSLAAGSGHEAVVELLLERSDVEADSKDNGGLTPLSWAALSGHEAVVNLLLGRSDVEADSKDYDGRTPLSWAAWSGYEAVVELLLERSDVEADSKDYDGRTPLSWAAESGNEEVVKLLLARSDVEADSKEYRGRTPLSRAAGSGNEAVVKLLLGRSDVKVDLQDNEGQTPLSWATRAGHETVVQLLLGRSDVEADLKDNGGLTPLSWATGRGHETVVRLLQSHISLP